MPPNRRLGTRARPRKTGSEASAPPSTQIDRMVRELPDWRGRTLSRLRSLIRQADPELVEEIKWRKPSNPDGVPVWSHNGIVCLGNVWKDHVRVTFSKGALLKDPKGVFNASLNGNFLRALDLREGDEFDEAALKKLVEAAVRLNITSSPRSR
jgi:hypothetical protein